MTGAVVAGAPERHSERVLFEVVAASAERGLHEVREMASIALGIARHLGLSSAVQNALAKAAATGAVPDGTGADE
jgi:hypothetical protein